jgi:hypothetical protein
MPKPENVNPGNFKVIHVVYNDNHFSIAYGDWQDEGEVLAMRWNGNDEGDAGYPKTFGNPMWFIVTNELKDILLASLLNSKHALKKNIITIMNNY